MTIEKDKIIVPKVSKEDHLYTGARVLISAIPGLGGPVLEMFNALLQTPLQKRDHEWKELITNAVIELQKTKSVRIEDLQENEKFISVLTGATIVAIKTHNQQKKEMLKNAVVNSVTNTSINDDFAALFVRYIDELTISHISLLEKMHSSANELQKIEKFEELYESLVSTKENKDTFKFLCEDLILRGLVRISQGILNPNDLYETDGETFEKEGEDNRPKVKITELGNEFLKFVLA
jgi:hypothetical protein